jgi:1-aminocyclopropane-1-carboxylate deaminase
LQQYAGKENDLKQSVSFVWRVQDKITENPTLLFAQNCGMQFEFISREAYQKTKRLLENLKQQFGAFI